MYCTGFFHHHDHTFALFQTFAYRLCDARPIFWIGNNAIDHHFDVVDLETIDLHFGSNLLQLSIDTDFSETLLTYLDEQLAVMTFTTTNDRCEKAQFFSFEVGEEG